MIFFKSLCSSSNTKAVFNIKFEGWRHYIFPASYQETYQVKYNSSPSTVHIKDTYKPHILENFCHNCDRNRNTYYNNIRL